MQTQIRSMYIGALCIVALCALATQSSAQSDVYKGKTISILIGYSAGGGYDQNARTLARYFGHHLPGSPNVIVQNMPGAGSLKAARYLDSGAPTDGTVFATFDPGLITDSLTVPDKVPERFTDYAWLGATFRDLRVCYAMAANPLKSWSDMMSAKEFTIGVTARGASGYKNSVVLKNMFNAPVRIVTGYPGSNDQRLAIQRGEIDVLCGNATSIPEDWIANRAVNVLVKFSPATTAGLAPDVPYIGDLAKTDEDRQILKILFASGELGRPFAASGKVDPGRVALLRAAFAKSMTDTGFLEEAKKQKLPVDWTSGEDAAKLVATIYRASPELIAKATKVVE